MKDYDVKVEVSGERLDCYVNSLGFGLSRSYIQKLIKDESLLVNAKVSKSSYKVEEGDRITFSVPDENEIRISLLIYIMRMMKCWLSISLRLW